MIACARMREDLSDADPRGEAAAEARRQGADAVRAARGALGPSADLAEAAKALPGGG
jgi:hypothetical protein